MAINEILEVGKQGMAANRQAMNIASNNIANANTPGYSRQRAVFTPTEQTFVNGVRVGRGVQVREAVRIHDAFVERQLIDQGKSFGAAQARSETLKRMESMLSGDSFRVTDLVNNFFNDARELSANPEQAALRTAVVLSARNAADGFRELGESLAGLQANLDTQIEMDVTTINTLAKELAGLNVSIAQTEARGVDAPHELEDRRQVILQELSTKLGVQPTTDQFGRKNLQVEGVGVLVNGDQVNELVTMRTPAAEGKAAGTVDVFVRDTNGLHKVTDKLQEGTIGGSLHVRDHVVNQFQGKLDTAAHAFAARVNEVHRGGVGADGLSGRDLFEVSDTPEGATASLRLSKDVENNADAFALGYDMGAQSDNRAVLDLVSLQDEKILTTGAATEGVPAKLQTLNESLTSLVGEVGLQTRNEEDLFQREENLIQQLKNYREGISGVNLEEEAMNLMQYQTVYNASAKAMKVGSELFETLLGIVD